MARILPVAYAVDKRSVVCNTLGMPKTRQDLTEIMQFRVSTEDKLLIEQASDADRTSVAEFLRRAARDAARRGVKRASGQESR